MFIYSLAHAALVLIESINNHFNFYITRYNVPDRNICALFAVYSV